MNTIEHKTSPYIYSSHIRFPHIPEKGKEKGKKRLDIKKEKALKEGNH